MSEEIKKTITNFSMKAAWNTAALRGDRTPEPRNYCWASELGKPMVDRWLTMKAVAPTNPPNDRSRSKFLAGNFFESIHGVVMAAMGIRAYAQQEVWVHSYGLPSVKGKLDFLIEGRPHYDAARSKIRTSGHDENMIDYLLNVVTRFEEINGNCSFEAHIREAKSCSQYLIDKLSDGFVVPGHAKQLYHYLKGTGQRVGSIDYLSRNDLLMEETEIRFPDSSIEQEIYGELVELKDWLKSGQQPGPAPLIVFAAGKFSKNLDVEYSKYLKLVYGFERPDVYDAAVKPRVSSWNRVLKRIRSAQLGETTQTGKKIELTDKNKGVIAEMSKEGYDAYALTADLDPNIDEEDDI